MAEHLHHVHIFARDLDVSVAWYRDMLGAEVAYDGELGGARNVFMRVGAGRLHLYDQRSRGSGKNAVHHVGIRTDNLAALVARLRAAGHAKCGEIRDFGWWKYFMCAAPDSVLLELFEVDSARAPDDLADYFRPPSQAVDAPGPGA